MMKGRQQLRETDRGRRKCRRHREITPVILSIIALLAGLGPRGSAAQGGGDPAPARVRVDDGNWIKGRATFFDASDELRTKVEAVRGEGSFGDLHFASCGYTERQPDDPVLDRNNMPFPIDAVAAVSTENYDFPGACGRCYEVQCETGTIPDADREVRTTDHFHMPNFVTDVKDSQGRLYPGAAPAPEAAEDLLYTRCWNDSASIVVRIIDVCPCDESNLETGGWEWCCGNEWHMDLSYWAFEKLAHPLHGAMAIKARPVDCDTQKPLPLNAFGDLVSDVVYDDRPRPGWEWRAWFQQWSYLWRPNAGLDSSNATCMRLSPDGGVSFACRECADSRYQPLADVSHISFWIRSDSSPGDSVFASSTPAGQVPPISMFARNPELQRNCDRRIFLPNRTAAEVQLGGWYRYTVPLAEFRCWDNAEVTLFAWQNLNNRNAEICLDEVRLLSRDVPPLQQPLAAEPPAATPPPIATAVAASLEQPGDGCPDAGRSGAVTTEVLSWQDRFAVKAQGSAGASYVFQLPPGRTVTSSWNSQVTALEGRSFRIDAQFREFGFRGSGGPVADVLFACAPAATDVDAELAAAADAAGGAGGLAAIPLAAPAAEASLEVTVGCPNAVAQPQEVLSWQSNFAVKAVGEPGETYYFTLPQELVVEDSWNSNVVPLGRGAHSVTLTYAEFGFSGTGGVLDSIDFSCDVQPAELPLAAVELSENGDAAAAQDQPGRVAAAAQDAADGAAAASRAGDAGDDAASGAGDADDDAASGAGDDAAAAERPRPPDEPCPAERAEAWEVRSWGSGFGVKAVGLPGETYYFRLRPHLAVNSSWNADITRLRDNVFRVVPEFANFGLVGSGGSQESLVFLCSRPAPFRRGSDAAAAASASRASAAAARAAAAGTLPRGVADRAARTSRLDLDAELADPPPAPSAEAGDDAALAAAVGGACRLSSQRVEVASGDQEFAVWVDATPGQRLVLELPDGRQLASSWNSVHRNLGGNVYVVQALRREMALLGAGGRLDRLTLFCLQGDNTTTIDLPPPMAG